MKTPTNTLLYLFLIFGAILSFANDCKIEEALPAAKKSQWHGGIKYDFTFDGKKALFVAPQSPRMDRAWIFRPAFFGAFPNADIELLKNGFFLAYLDLTHRYASPAAMDDADKFYKFAVEKCGLSQKLVVEGLSRGGAFVLCWANRDPSKFAAVYADAPVCDFNSWPSPKREKLFRQFLAEWNIKSADKFRGNPVDNFANLAQSGVPLLLIAGDSDKTVPFGENGKIYAQRFQNAGGNLTMTIKKGCDHHPHGLADPAPTVAFIKKAFENGGKK